MRGKPTLTPHHIGPTPAPSWISCHTYENPFHFTSSYVEMIGSTLLCTYNHLQNKRT